MKLIAEWQLLMSKPSAARTATIALGVMWAIAAIWGWFFVEPTVLRDSQAARNFVDFATSVFPWLNNIKKLGADAEKGLFLHSVYFFALAPGAIVSACITMLSPAAVRMLAEESRIKTFGTACFCFLFAALLVWVMYKYIFQPSFGKLHRTGYSFAINNFTVPLSAPFFIIGFWSAVFAGFHSIYYVVFKKPLTCKHDA